jgi:hypothetical protein
MPTVLRRAVLALPLALLASGLFAPATASARRRGSCSVSMEASSPVVGAGEAAKLLGHLSCPEGISAAGETLAILQREHGGGEAGLSEVASVTTSEAGAFEATTAPLTGKSVFVVRSLLASGGRTVVRVTPKVTLEGPAAGVVAMTTRGDRSSGGRTRFTFTGTVDPVLAGMRVSLQREYAASGEGWHTIAFGQLDEEGHYSITHGFDTVGEVSVRVVVHPHGELPLTSEPLNYDITQAQNPALTIESSADPLAPGATANITGVAAGAVGQAVMLLASSHGQRFAPVAKASTEAGGAYSFAVTPSANTTYRVIDAHARSTELFECVTATP